MIAPRASYLICTNPRSGSWLLTEGLRATGVVGLPEEYFNPRLRSLYLRDFQLEDDASAVDLLARILAAGTSDNGIFGAKVHRLHYDSMIALIRDATGDRQADEASLLKEAFPHLTLVHHDREDRVAQALSWFRALRTGNWWHVRGRRDIRPEDDIELDVEQVRALEERLVTDDARWRAFFAVAGLPVVSTTYEGLVADHDSTVRRVITAVGGPSDVAIAAPAMLRQADNRTQRWRRSYLQARARRPGRAGVSIVVVSHNEGDNLLRTLESLRGTTPPLSEIIVVDDVSTDGSVDRALRERAGIKVVRPEERLGVAGARNAGARVATGDVVVFSDAHVSAQEGWLPTLMDELADPEVGIVAPVIADMHRRSFRGYGFTWADLSMSVQWLRDPPEVTTDVPFACGCFLAMRHDTFDSVGGFDEGLLRWGSEDAELSLRTWRRGLRCVVAPQALIAHLFRASFGYAVEWEHTLHNILRVGAVHLPAEALERTLELHRGHPAFPRAVALMDLEDIAERRRELDRCGSLDGRGFLDKFSIPVLA